MIDLRHHKCLNSSNWRGSDGECFSIWGEVERLFKLEGLVLGHDLILDGAEGVVGGEGLRTVRKEQPFLVLD